MIEKWTYPGSTSCQFILRLNVRFILVLSRLLKSELRDILKAVLPMDTGDHSKPLEDSANFKPYAENILPLLRIYMSWICTYRLDMVKYGEHLEPYAHDMYRTLGQALTLVIQEFLGQDLATSSYLLPEDLEALGLNPLDDISLPSECRLHYVSDKDTRKPRPGDVGCTPTTPQQELLSRIYDILSCGYFLATDRIFPFAMITIHEESRDITAITYQEEGSSQQFEEPIAEPSTTEQPTSGVGDLLGKFNDLQASPVAGEQRSRHSLTRDSFGKPSKAQDILASPRRGEVDSPTGQTQSASKAAAAEFESEFNIDRDMYNLVNDFLAPPETRADQASHGEETSYGMHSSPANDVFGSIQNKSPPPGSATMKAFPTLPWDFFISPAPHGPGQEGGVTRGLEHDMPQQKFPGSPETFAQYRNTRFVDDSFPSSSGLQSPFRDARRNVDASESVSTRYTKPAVEPNFQGGYTRQTRSDNTNVPQDHSASSQRFGNQSSVPGDRSGQHAWPAANAYTHAMEPPSTMNGASFWQTSGLGADKAAFTSSNFSQTASSLPPVNSPWGLPAARQTSVTQQSHMYPYGGALADSSATFSPPNSLYQSNGNFYNATTAFGRGPIANKDDPTHFKNAVKRTEIAAAVEAADAYDRAILAGALLDDKRPQR